jgi:hypothetical protein
MCQFDRKDSLKTRHFIVVDQMNTQQKIASLKKEPFQWIKITLEKVNNFLTHLFQKTERS